MTLPDQPGTATRVDIEVGAAAAAKIELEGNNQAAVAGMRLPLPPGCPAGPIVSTTLSRALSSASTVEQGGWTGSLPATGRCRSRREWMAAPPAPFVVSSNAGQNVVYASVEGTDHGGRFIAFGTEV